MLLTGAVVSDTGLNAGWGSPGVGGWQYRGGLGTVVYRSFANVNHNFAPSQVTFAQGVNFPVIFSRANLIFAWRFYDPVSPYTQDFTATAATSANRFTTAPYIVSGAYAPPAAYSATSLEFLSFDEGSLVDTSGGQYQVSASDAMRFDEGWNTRVGAQYERTASDGLSFVNTDLSVDVNHVSQFQVSVMDELIFSEHGGEIVEGGEVMLTESLGFSETADVALNDVPVPEERGGGFIPVM